MISADIAVILLIWFLFAIECIAWTGRGDVCFRSLTGKAWKIARPGASFEIAHASPIFLFPFPPLGMLIPGHLPLIAYSPEGVSGYVAESENAPPDRGVAYYRYEQIENLKIQGQEILINGRVFARAHSKAGAKDAEGLIERIKRGRIRDREGLILERIGGLFEDSQIKDSIERFVERTALPAMVSNLLWAYMIIGIPVVIYVYGFSRIALWLLAIVLQLHLVIVGMAFHKYRTIHGVRGYSLLWHLLPSPFNSIRATDLLAKELLAEYHPFAAAAALLPKERFLSYARRSLAQIRYPRYDPDMSTAARETDQWFKERIIQAMERSAKKMGIDVEGLGKPESLDGETGYSSFCPRCHCLYEQGEGVCGDCAGTKLVPL
jgi:hypothetical protein